MKIKKRKTKEEVPFEPGISSARKFPDMTRVARQSKLYQFNRDGVSPSYINSFMQCREQFRLQTVEGLSQIGYDFAMEYGTLWHWLHQNWVTEGGLDIKAAIKKYRSKVYAGTKTPQALEQQEIGYAQAFGVWPVYAEFYKRDLKDEWVEVEGSFDIPYEIYPGATTRLRGKRDGVKRRKSNALILHEMKLKGQINTQVLEDTLHLDTQNMLYLLSLILEGAEDIWGVEYDVIRRSQSEPRKGEMHSDYSKRMAAEAEKDPLHFFHRIPLCISPRDVELWRLNFLQPILIEMHRWSEGKALHFVNMAGLVPKPYASDYLQTIATGNRYGLGVVKPFSHHKE